MSPIVSKRHPYTVRYATEEDVPIIHGLIIELATYEKAAHEVVATRQLLLETLSFPSNPAKGYAKTLLISPSSGSDTESSSPEAGVAGMALFFHNYSTWHASPGIFLEDLYIKPEFRGRGFGRALLSELAKECLRLGCKRLEWNVLKWNKPSIDFYESNAVGATMMNEWVGMRVDGEGLGKLAGEEADSAPGCRG